MQLGPLSGRMRDRRNTNLSISSAGSFVSAHTSPVVADHAQDSAEKGRFLWIPVREDSEPLPSPLLMRAKTIMASLVIGKRHPAGAQSSCLLF
jgi:hypothetical protein